MDEVSGVSGKEKSVETKYLGKKQLFNFLKENGYTSLKMKDFEYSRYRGSEWLKNSDLNLYVMKRSQKLRLTLYEEDGQAEMEYLVFENEKLIYHTSRAI